MQRRFIELSEVCSIFDISESQVYALVRSGELRAIKIGGRGRWRVEVAEIDAFVLRMYAETQAFVSEHPYGLSGEPAPGSAESE